MSEPKTDQTEMKRLAYCGEQVLNHCHLDDVYFAGNPESCPVCKQRYAHAETRGKLTWCEGEIDRLKKIDGENNKLQSRICELEDQLVCTTCGGSKTVECSCLEPKRPDCHGSYNCQVPCRRCDGSQELPCPECRKKEARP